jgi:DNA-binding CsgD family transcriptional regulator
VLELMAEGLTHAEMARNLSASEQQFVSEETAKSIECQVLARLHARSPAHAVAISMRLRLIA